MVDNIKIKFIYIFFFLIFFFLVVKKYNKVCFFPSKNYIYNIRKLILFNIKIFYQNNYF